MTYAIMVNYHMWNEQKGEYDEPHYLGLMGEKRIFVFDPNVTERTKIFTSLSEALNYIKFHKLNDSICFDKARPVTISI